MLPTELLLQVFVSCDILDILQCSLVCRRWRNVIIDYDVSFKVHNSDSSQTEEEESGYFGSRMPLPAFGPHLNKLLRTALAYKCMSQETIYISADDIVKPTAHKVQPDKVEMCLENDLDSFLPRAFRNKLYLTLHSTNSWSTVVFDLNTLELEFLTEDIGPQFEQDGVVYLGKHKFYVRRGDLIQLEVAPDFDRLICATRNGVWHLKSNPGGRKNYSSCDTLYESDITAGQNVLWNKDKIAIVDGDRITITSRSAKKVLVHRRRLCIYDPWYVTLLGSVKSMAVCMTDTHLIYYNRRERYLATCPVDEVIHSSRELQWHRLIELERGVSGYHLGSNVVCSQRFVTINSGEKHVLVIDLISSAIRVYTSEFDHDSSLGEFDNRSIHSDGFWTFSSDGQVRFLSIGHIDDMISSNRRRRDFGDYEDVGYGGTESDMYMTIILSKWNARLRGMGNV